ncbi:MAG: zinc ribbon domain-containing protein [Actinomycetota bacterium]|nr:zinc ribbon domain-containing protein [Actinomycetota bacterium]
MYCINCGTINPDRSEYCLKCGGGFAKAVGAEAPSAVDIALAARPVGAGHSGSTKSSTSRLIVASLAAVLILTIPLIFLLRQTRGAAGSGGPGPAPRHFSAGVITDAARKANASRLQAAIAQFYAQTDRYPASISEIPPAMLGFNFDPAVYHYTVLPNSSGFRVEVIMESRNISGSHIVSEGDVTKYVYEGQ